MHPDDHAPQAGPTAGAVARSMTRQHRHLPARSRNPRESPKFLMSWSALRLQMIAFRIPSRTGCVVIVGLPPPA